RAVSIDAMSRTILQQAYGAEAGFLSLLEDLVTRESPTHDEAACDALAVHLEQLLEERAFTVTRHERAGVGDIIEARIGGGAGPATLLLTHYDTVWPIGTLSQMPWRRDGDDVYGPGTLDMKAGIANALTAIDIARRRELPL